MEFLPDNLCCTKCLKKGIRIAYDQKRAQARNGNYGKGRYHRLHLSPHWCKSCWQERHRRIHECESRTKQLRLRCLEWEARAMMTKEERRRTPLVHIPWGCMKGPRKGKPRNPLTWLSQYAIFRNRAMRRLYGLPPLPRGGVRAVNHQLPKNRHAVLPTA